MQTIKRLMQKHIIGMITCEQVDNFLYDYHEGCLSSVESFKFKLHLSMCSECKKYVHDYKQTLHKIKNNYNSISSTDKIPEELVQTILNIRKTNNTEN